MVVEATLLSLTFKWIGELVRDKWSIYVNCLNG